MSIPGDCFSGIKRANAALSNKILDLGRSHRIADWEESERADGKICRSVIIPMAAERKGSTDTVSLNIGQSRKDDNK